MTRVVGRIGFVAAALALFATSMANAAPLRFDPDPTAIPTGSSGDPRDGTWHGTGFENPDTDGNYALGTISNQNGWRCFGAANATPPGPRCGTGVVPKGHGSPQGVLVDQNPNHPAPTNVGYFSPKFYSFTQANVVNWDMKINDQAGADYQVVVQSPTETFVNTRLLFYYNNYIYALDSPDGGTTVVFATAGTWTGGGQEAWLTWQLAMDFTNRTFLLSAGSDKDHLFPIYQSSWLFATTAEEVLFFSDNFPNFAVDPTEPAGMYVDNVVIKPEPGTLAMLGAGLLLALRRRKA